MGRLERLGEETDGLIFELIDAAARRRRQRLRTCSPCCSLPAHEDGSPMSPAELRDELVTALVAGHETTASQLAWGF